MIEITKRFTFEAAHWLPWHQGKCRNLHGHSYKLEVTLSSKNLNQNGIVLDFDTLGQMIDEVATKRYDHKFLNDFFENPTAEIIAIEIYANVTRLLRMNDFSGVILTKVKLWETEKCSVTITDLTVDV